MRQSFKSREAVLPAAVMALVLSGCAAGPAANLLPDEIVSLKRGGDTRLINEGGPVFAMPGKVEIPAYMGQKDAIVVTGERVNGSAVLGISHVNADPDGTFDLSVPANAGLFFATTVVTHDDSLHRIRTLVRPEDGREILIDPAATLVASKIMLASKRHKSAELGAMYDLTADLTAYIRANVPATDLGLVWLDRPNDELAATLDGIAARTPGLESKLRGWEQKLYSNEAVPPAPVAAIEAPAVGLPILGPPPK